MRTAISFLTLLVIAIFSTIQVNGQRKKTPPKPPLKQVPSTVSDGIFVGNATNLTKKLSGSVTFNLLEFDRRSGNAKASVEFYSGLCGEGSLTGIIDEEGMTLNGILSCSEKVRNIISRCTFKGGDKIACNYTLKPLNSSQISDKGTFDLARYSENRSNTTTRTIGSSSTTTTKKYKVVFPTGAFKVDLGIVNTDFVVLKSSPDNSASNIKTLVPGDLVTLVGRTPVDGWLKVIDYKSGDIGWVNIGNIEVKFGDIEEEEKFLERSAGTYGEDPVIIIKNDTNTSVSFGFGDQIHTIGPYRSLSLDIKPGNYKYFVSSPGAIPLIGKESFQSGYNYTWTLYLASSR